MFRHPHILEMSFSTLQIKHDVGIIVTILSCFCMIYMLVHIQRQYNMIQVSDMEELDIGSDTKLELEHEIEFPPRTSSNDPDDNDNDNDNNKESSLGASDDKGSSDTSSYVNVTIGDDDHVEKTNPNNTKTSNNMTKLYRYRKLLPSQWIFVMVQVSILTLLNYLLLVAMPNHGWISFVGMAVVYVLTLRNVIAEEIMRYQRFDRCCFLITLCGSIATGLTCVVYTRLALQDQYMYRGPARIVGYDTNDHTATTKYKTNTTIQTNLQVAWGGTWGCPMMKNQSHFCTADIKGIVCDTSTITTEPGGGGGGQQVAQNPISDDYYKWLSYNDTDDYMNMNSTSTYSSHTDDDHEEFLYKDKNEEVDVETKYDNCDEEEAIDVIITDPHNSSNIEEVIEIQHNDNYSYDIDSNQTNDQVNITYGKNATTYNQADIGNRGEDNTTKNDKNNHGGHRQQRRQRNLQQQKYGTTPLRRQLSTSKATTTANNTTATNVTTTNNTYVDEQVSEQMKNITNADQKEVTDFENEVYDEAVNKVDEDLDIGVEEEIVSLEMTIQQLENENDILTNENEQLTQENEQLQNEINQQIQQDQTIIQNETQIVNEKENSILDHTGQYGIPQTQISNDDNYISDDYISTMGQYACEDLFSIPQYNDDGTRASYDPNIPPAGYNNTNYNHHDLWPTIPIYGNCDTCTAYMVDYYSTEHYHTITQYSKQMTGYFFTTIICFMMTIFFTIRYHVYGDHQDYHTRYYNTTAMGDKRKDLLSSTHGSTKSNRF